MTAIYLFCLIVGGGLAALSLFGDAFDGDVDADLDADLDVELDLDADAAEVDLAADDIGVDAAKIFSLRGLIYGLFGFGAIGLALGWITPGQPVLTAAFSAGGGLLTSVLVTRIVRWLRSSEAGENLSDRGFVGRRGKVLLPIRPDAPGQIRVTRAGRTYRLRALPHEADAADPASWDEVLVIEMREGMAYVTSREALEELDDLALEEPGSPET